VNRILVIF